MSGGGCYKSFLLEKLGRKKNFLAGQKFLKRGEKKGGGGKKGVYAWLTVTNATLSCTSMKRTGLAREEMKVKDLLD